MSTSTNMLTVTTENDTDNEYQLPLGKTEIIKKFAREDSNKVKYEISPNSTELCVF
jgi:hypothetical protein